MYDVRAVINRMKDATNSRRYEDLADILGVKLVTINNWKKRGKVPEKNILKCVLLTNKSKEWFLTGEESSIKQETILHQSDALSVSLLQAGAGEGVYNFESQELLLSLNAAKFPYLAKEHLAAVEIVGESMEPTLRQGDFILITPPKDQRETEDGIYAIRIEGMIKVKSLHFKLDGTIDIISDNPKYTTETYDPEKSQIDFAILGKKRLLLSR